MNVVSFYRILGSSVLLSVTLPWSCGLLAAARPAAGQSRPEQAHALISQSGVTGGLVVHVGCGDGQLTLELHASERYLVFGVDRDAGNVEAARRAARAAGLDGQVTFAEWRGIRLPCIDNIVNLLVVEQDAVVSAEEIQRVLCPRGVALIRQDGATDKFVKPWPDEIDEWTHYLHGPDNNAVARDRVVAAPKYVQWIGGPKWARHHNHLSSTSAMVSARGRVFAIIDEGPAPSLALPAQWRLVARDAFNGIVLWKRPIGPWESVLRPFRSGPVELARRLVAVGERVYVTPGYNQPIVTLAAATGDVLHEYTNTHDALEFAVVDDRLFVVAGSMDREEYEANRRRGLPSPAPREKRIVVIDAMTGDTIWSKSDRDTAELLPSTLCISGGRLLLHNPHHLICLNAATGDELWRAERPLEARRLSWSAPTLVVRDNVVLSADRATDTNGRASSLPDHVSWKVTAGTGSKATAVGQLIAYSLTDGRKLWSCPTALGYNSPPDVLVAGGLVWTGSQPGRNQADFREGRDLRTGEVKRRFETDSLFSVAHHHRCYRNKATERFIVLGRTGVELIDLTDGDLIRNYWVRGACQYGVMPANGLVYTPPHSCACYIQSKLSGFYALASQRATLVRDADIDRLVRGPANLPAQEANSDTATSTAENWPAFRHDAARSGRSGTRIPSDLSLSWRTDIGGRLSSPVIAGRHLLVSSIDHHTLHALDAQSGQPLWTRTVGGRVDSPPTIESGLVVFGCADGWIYCLRLADGQLVWRFRAAPSDLRLVSCGQLESVWPVTGSVLIRGDVVYCTAGRSSFVDGGMILHRLALRTGQQLGMTMFDDRDPQTGYQKEETIEDVELPGALPDVLVDDGQYLYLRDKVLDYDGVEQVGTKVPHLYCSAGLLDDNWWHRTAWLWGERNWGRASGWAVMPGIRPSGRILVTDDETVFGYGRRRVQGNTMKGYHLFRANKEVEELDRTIKNNNVALEAQQKPARVTYRWSRDVPLVVRAMALTDQLLLAAGPRMDPADAGINEPTFDSATPAALMAFRTEDGRDLAELALPSQPVFDGMALARGALFMSLVDGTVVCYNAP